MAENSNIAWTDHTFNPWKGCTKVSPGCANCYAAHEADTRYGQAKWGPQGERVKTTEQYWGKPITWNAKARAAGVRARVFCASWADVFEDWQGPILNHQKQQLFRDGDAYFAPGRDHIATSSPATMDDLRRDLFRMIDATPWLDWLLLTKRPENIRRMMMPWLRDRMGAGIESPDDAWTQGIPVRNLWLGTTVENKNYAEVRIPELLKCRDLSPVLFVSYEPALESVNWRGMPMPATYRLDCLLGELRGGITRDVKPHAKIDWLIVGGESDQGEKARRFEVQWARESIRQCRETGVPVFMKQVGSNAWLNYDELDAWREKKGYVPLRDKAGAKPDEWPEDLRVREFPKVTCV